MNVKSKIQMTEVSKDSPQTTIQGQKTNVSSKQILEQLAESNWPLADVDQAAVMLQPQPKSTVAKLTGADGAESPMAKIFRVGFAGIFLANGIIAALRPEDFMTLITGFPVTHAIGHADILVKLVALNDLLLATLILSGRAKKFVWAWAGAYLAAVSFVKLLSLF